MKILAVVLLCLAVIAAAATSVTALEPWDQAGRVVGVDSMLSERLCLSGINNVSADSRAKACFKASAGDGKYVRYFYVCNLAARTVDAYQCGAVSGVHDNLLGDVCSVDTVGGCNKVETFSSPTFDFASGKLVPDFRDAPHLKFTTPMSKYSTYIYSYKIALRGEFYHLFNQFLYVDAQYDTTKLPCPETPTKHLPYPAGAQTCLSWQYSYSTGASYRYACGTAAAPTQPQDVSFVEQNCAIYGQNGYPAKHSIESHQNATCYGSGDSFKYRRTCFPAPGNDIYVFLANYSTTTQRISDGEESAGCAPFSSVALALLFAVIAILP